MITLENINKVLILGSGTLGLRVGLQCAISGYQTTIYDIDKKAFDAAREQHEEILKGLVKRNEISKEEAAAVKSRLTWTTDIEKASEKADFVNESVTEDVAIKKTVWKQVGALCPKHAILTTNTSSFLPSMFAEESGRPENFCAFHFHDVFWSNVVDIMVHKGTNHEVIPLLKKLAIKLKQVPVVIQKETPRYIFNAMLAQILDTAGLLVADGKASVQDVDRAWMGNLKTPTGPFGMLDLIGLDTAWHVSSARENADSQRFATFLKQYIDQGKMGVKTGEGFYSYPNPEYKNKDFLKGQA